MLNLTRISTAVAALTIMVGSTACEQEDPMQAETTTPTFAAFDSTFSTNTNRRFEQMERLANPLVMEAFVQKREHDAYDAFPAIQDPAQFTDDIVNFVTTVAQREEAYGRAIAGALIGTTTSDPGDKIRVFTNRQAGATAGNMSTNMSVGYLSQVTDPTGGYGGRKPSDDVVDTSLSVVFGSALGDMTNNSPGLVTDNVDSNDKPFPNTFPYLPEPSL
ncbi:MAG: DUF4331 domain-containing protein [Gemmatimonadetes bacterium]|nr:DUF4331 domain-containing protein [Gemmatimonadota bacterium]